MRLWDAETGEQKGVLTGDEYRGGSVVFSPDGMTLAGTSLKKTVLLWDVETGEQKGVLTGHKYGGAKDSVPSGWHDACHCGLGRCGCGMRRRVEAHVHRACGSGLRRSVQSGWEDAWWKWKSLSRYGPYGAVVGCCDMDAQANTHRAYGDGA